MGIETDVLALRLIGQILCVAGALSVLNPLAERLRERRRQRLRDRRGADDS